MDMTIPIFTLTVLALLTLVGVFAAGVPFAGRTAARADVGWSTVATHDRRLVKFLKSSVGAIVAGALFGVWAEPGAVVVLALVMGVGAPLALDRWQRTNGDRAPLSKVLELEPMPTRYTGDIEELLRMVAAVPRPVLAELAAIEGDAKLRERICDLLAAEMLRISRGGDPEWVSFDAGRSPHGVMDEGFVVPGREGMAALACAHPEVRTAVLRMTR